MYVYILQHGKQNTANSNEDSQPYTFSSLSIVNGVVFRWVI
jgi:hypothetical protein